MKNKDAEIIYRSYIAAYEKSSQKSKYMPKMAEVLWQKKSGLIDNLLKLCTSGQLSNVEKANIIYDTKGIYQEFIRCIKSSEPSVCVEDMDKMYTLIRYVAEYEQEEVGEYRKQLFAGERLRLEEILSDNEYFMQITQRPVRKILDQYLGENDNNILNKKFVYISKTGKKYHREECPYIKSGKITEKVSLGLAKNYGLVPCNCFTGKRAMYRNLTMTAFIDESIRISPWKNMKGVSKKTQSCYSYIICRGDISSEKEITEDDIIATRAGALEKEIGTTDTAIETINIVLMKLAFDINYNKAVKIYTDNKGAALSWNRDNQSKYLASLFSEVSVNFIPREENTVADKIGRDISFFDVPTKVMERIVYKCKIYDEFAKKIV